MQLFSIVEITDADMVAINAAIKTYKAMAKDQAAYDTIVRRLDDLNKRIADGIIEPKRKRPG